MLMHLCSLHTFYSGEFYPNTSPSKQRLKLSARRGWRESISVSWHKSGYSSLALSEFNCAAEYSLERCSEVHLFSYMAFISSTLLLSKDSSLKSANGLSSRRISWSKTSFTASIAD